ncbi:hypothetical protein PLESTF_000868700 [Pleodorina starrii]|nr:hypothetical protein PLESTF_000868700 [Pleodorina starrii]
MLDNTVDPFSSQRKASKLIREAGVKRKNTDGAGNRDARAPRAAQRQAEEHVDDLKERAATAFRDGDLLLCISLTNQATNVVKEALLNMVGGQRCAFAREQSRLHSNLAAAHLELDDYHAAAKEARAAIELDPSWHRPYLRLCMALTGLHGSSDAAADALRSGLTKCQSPDQLRELQDALAALQRSPPRPNDIAADQDAATRLVGEACPSSGAAAPSLDSPRPDQPLAVGRGAKRRRSTAAGAGPSPALTTAPPDTQAPRNSAGAQRNSGLQPPFDEAQRSSSGMQGQAASDRQQQQQPPQRRRLPVTALCGFLGAGKTTLVRHLLTCLGAAGAGGGGASRVGLLVNDLAPANIDAQLLALPPPPPPPAPPPPYGTATGPDDACADGDNVPLAASACRSDLGRPAAAAAPGGVGPSAAAAAAASAAAAAGPPPPDQGPAELLELSNGCVCCNLRGELQQQLRRLAARRPPLEHLIVECTGVGEPAALAAAVRALEDEGDLAVELGSMVTVVDAGAFLELMAGGGGGGGDESSGGGEDSGRRIVGARQACGLNSAAAAAAEGRGESAAAAGAAGGGGSPGSGAGSGAGQRPLAQLLAQQVEAADVVLLNKCDRLMERVRQQQQQQRQRQRRGQSGEQRPRHPKHDQQQQQAREQGRQQEQQQATAGTAEVTALVGAEAEAEALAALRRVRAVVRALNPSARVLPCVRCAVSLETILQPHPQPPSSPPAPPGEQHQSDPAPPPSHPTPGARRHLDPGPGRLVDGLLGSLPEELGAREQPATRTAVASAAATAAAASIGGPITGDFGERANEEDEYGIGSYVFRSRAPFHPARLWALLRALAGTPEDEEEEEEGEEEGGVEDNGLPALPCRAPALLRAKGFFWVASLSQAMWELSLAGGQVELEAVGRWLCTMVDPEHWPVGRRDSASGAAASSRDGAGDDDDYEDGGGDGPHRLRWHRRWGDRRNELVFIGVGLEQRQRQLGLGSGLGPLGNGAEAPGEEEVQGCRRSQRMPTAAPAALPARAADAEAGAVCVGSPGTGQGSGAAAAACVGGGVAAEAPAERLAALLRWAQLSPREAAAGEEVWEAWDDAPWLALLERY